MAESNNNVPEVKGKAQNQVEETGADTKVLEEKAHTPKKNKEDKQSKGNVTKDTKDNSETVSQKKKVTVTESKKDESDIDKIESNESTKHTKPANLTKSIKSTEPSEPSSKVTKESKKKATEKSPDEDEIIDVDELETGDADVIVADEVIPEVKKAKVPKSASTNKSLENWKPKTKLGRDVLNGKITNIDEILASSAKILEPEIVDMLVPNLSSQLLLIGQSKGKFGGGRKKVFRQTQKKTREGNKIKFTVMTVVGDENGHIGLGKGKAKETVPAREKSLRDAKLNMITIARGCGSWECGCGTPHSVPFKVTGKSGSIKVTILPAPRGKGIIGEKDVSQLLVKAGIKDAWVNIKGKSNSRINMILACFNALKKLSSIKVNESYAREAGLVYGSINNYSANNSKQTDSNETSESDKDFNVKVAE